MILDSVKPEDLPRFTSWKQSLSGGQGLTLLDFLHSQATLDIAVGFAEMFFPKIITFKGCFFREQAYRKSHVTLKANMTLETKQKAEQLINHLHIYDLFSSEHPDTKLEVEEALAKTLLESWAFAAKKQFPNQDFSFEFQTEPESYGPTITFWQI